MKEEGPEGLEEVVGGGGEGDWEGAAVDIVGDGGKREEGRGVRGVWRYTLRPQIVYSNHKVRRPID